MGIPNRYDDRFPAAKAAAALWVSCLFFCLSLTWSSGRVETALAASDFTPLELDQFYEGYLNQPYYGQDPASLPPFTKAALERFASQKRKSERLGKAAKVTGGLGGALLVAAPFLSRVGRRAPSLLGGTRSGSGSGGEAPPAYDEHDVNRTKQQPLLSRLNGKSVASGLATASAVLGGALLIGAAAALISRCATRAKSEAEKERMKRILLRRMETMGVDPSDISGSPPSPSPPAAHLDVAAGVAGGAVRQAQKEEDDVDAAVAAAVNASLSTPEATGAPQGQGRQGVWIGLGSNGNDKESELRDVQQFVDLAMKTGNSAVYYPS